MRTLLSLILIFFVQQIIAQTYRDTIANNVGLAIENTFHNVDASFISAIFQDSVFCSHILVGPEENEAVALANLAFKQMDFGREFANLTSSTIEQSYQYEFINFHADESNNYYLIFRLFGNNDLDYHEYFLEFIDEETYYISDIYTFMDNELLSANYKETYKLTIELNNQFLIDQPKEGITIDLDEEFMSEIQGMMNTLTDIVPLDSHNNAPSGLIGQEEKALVIKAHFINAENETHYRDRIRYLNLSDKTKVSNHLNSIKQYTDTGNYTKALHAVDSVDYYISDNFLDFFRACVNLTNSNIDQAEYYFQEVLVNYPQFPEPYIGLLALYYYQEKYQELLKALDQASENLGKALDMLKGEIAISFPPLHQSELYQDWLTKKD